MPDHRQKKNPNPRATTTLGPHTCAATATGHLPQPLTTPTPPPPLHTMTVSARRAYTRSTKQGIVIIAGISDHLRIQGSIKHMCHEGEYYKMS
jgi:hypothetical protein